ncbi:MAG: Ig-like domain-containing protein, partial [Vitreimonas sp.]
PFQPAWSRDGTQLAFMVQMPTGFEVWVSPYPTTPTGFRRVTPADGMVRDFPSWTPDNHVLFMKMAVGADAPGIFAVDVTTGAETEIVAAHGGGEWYPTLSPDGNRLLWSSERHSEDGDVFVAPYGGATPIPEASQRRVTAVSGYNFLFWSPEGHRIVAETYPDIRDIAVLNEDGTGLHTLEENPAFDLNPSWGVVSRGPLTPGSLPSTLQVTALPIVQNGGAQVLPSGRVRFTPAAGFVGNASFTYTVSDGQTTDTGTVTVAVLNLNSPPVATDDAFEIPEDLPEISFSVLANDTDPDSDSLVVTAVTPASHGIVDFNPAISLTTVRYVPQQRFQGIDTFTYTVSDGHGGTDTAQVIVTVTSVNDPPFVSVQLPDQNVDQTAPNTVLELNAFFDDEDISTAGDVLNFSVLSNTNPAVVTATVVNGVLTLDYLAPGTATISIRAEDSFDAAVVDTFTVTVTTSDTNDPPVAVDDVAETAEDTPVDIAVLTNDTDPDNDTLVISGIGAAGHGTVTQAIGQPHILRYSPNGNFNGPDVFTYTISDGQGHEDTATVQVTVTPANDPPSPIQSLPQVFVNTGAPDQEIDLTEYITDVDIATNGDMLR